MRRTVLFAGAATIYTFSVNGGIFNGTQLADVVAGWGPPYFAALWVSQDSERSGYRPAFHYLLWTWILWPVVVPHYVLKSRGRDGLSLAIGLWALLAAPALGAIAGWWLYEELPDFR